MRLGIRIFNMCLGIAVGGPAIAALIYGGLWAVVYARENLPMPAVF